MQIWVVNRLNVVYRKKFSIDFYRIVPRNVWLIGFFYKIDYLSRGCILLLVNWGQVTQWSCASLWHIYWVEITAKGVGIRKFP